MFREHTCFQMTFVRSKVFVAVTVAWLLCGWNNLHVISHTRPSHFSAYNVEKLGVAWGRGYFCVCVSLKTQAIIKHQQKKGGTCTVCTCTCMHMYMYCTNTVSSPILSKISCFCYSISMNDFQMYTCTCKRFSHISHRIIDWLHNT